MKKGLFISAIGMMLFADACIGALVVALVGRSWNIWGHMWPLTALGMITLGSVLALLPDLDIAYPLLKGKHDDLHEHHTMLMHRPLLVLPAVTGLAWLVSDFLIGHHLWTVVAFTCIAWHFVHDTYGFGGAGLEWFWPLSKREWSPFGQPTANLHVTLAEWLPSWYKPSPLSFREIVIGSAALSLAMGIVFGYRTAEVFFVLPILGTFFVWGLYSIFGD